MAKLSKGYVQIYTGNGKGKTSAAIGLAVRAAGYGLIVCMVQFLKGGASGEIESVKRLQPNFKIYRFEKERGFFWTLSDEEKIELKKEIQQGYDFCAELLLNSKCDILVMDEIMGAVSNKLISEEQVVNLIKNKPDNIELILTGRNVPESILGLADLVTEMKDIKHYFDKGVPAREGIEY